MQSLGWRNEESQTRRFTALSQWGNLSGLSILDLGCGRGDLKPFLDSHFDNFCYIGVDMMPEFIVDAKARYGQLQNTTFLLGEFSSLTIPPVDVIIASGSLNYQNSESQHPRPTIQRLWDACQMGLAFNLLDASELPSAGLLQSYQPKEILHFCQSLDPHATLLTGYHPEDFTILMHR